MRSTSVLPLVLGLVGACVTPNGGPGYGGGPYGDDDGGGDDGGGGGGGGIYGGYCGSDSDCVSELGSGYVCARDEECQLASNVRTVRITWTIMGSAAGSDTCASSPDLELLFNTEGDLSGTNYEFGFAPVPCVEGVFSIDKLPSAYAYVGLFDQSTFDEDDSAGVTGTFDGSGDCALDLNF
ncbi:MAG TPA: hypothetical protein VGG28_20225 [Kofleriaceae bacterium]